MHNCVPMSTVRKWCLWWMILIPLQKKKFYHHWRLLKGEAQCHYLCLYQE